ncbi:hypothetical protein RhiirA1_476200 [Rhizophagus irregularis]|uniref:F-box domain-containing protein n=1 Tax=Rhizophagus irregularis TaxID=588596 RepID=A0A2N0QVK0_9GLOM|nr:hypothetical protein RhiirA1_476200 [Rhizophagus irregularis]
MSCSKIFSGDLPELTYEVIKYFQNDYSTLYSCILVNRLWCRLAIPLLWENPFSILTKNYNFIEIYLHNLNDDLKTKLNEFKIIDNSLPSNTLLYYPKFLKYLNTHNFIFFVEKWLKYYSRSYNRLGDVYVLLLTIFIENEVNLHTLEIEISCDYYNSFFDKILESILQSTNFIHSIINLKLYINNYNENTVRNRILPLIHSHQNLKKIMIGDYYLSLYQSLLLLKEYNCSNTLNTITFYGTNFKDIINLDKVFEQLNVLESCSSIVLQNLGQILPSKLEYLCLCLLHIKANDFEIFLKNSKDTFIKKLLICNNEGQDILPCIKKYIMKKKRAKYLAIYSSFDKIKELFSLKDEVKEFELYNIKVQSYESSEICISDFIN